MSPHVAAIHSSQVTLTRLRELFWGAYIQVGVAPVAPQLCYLGHVESLNCCCCWLDEERQEQQRGGSGGAREREKH